MLNLGLIFLDFDITIIGHSFLEATIGMVLIVGRRALLSDRKIGEEYLCHPGERR